MLCRDVVDSGKPSGLYGTALHSLFRKMQFEHKYIVFFPVHRSHGKIMRQYAFKQLVSHLKISDTGHFISTDVIFMNRPGDQIPGM